MERYPYIDKGRILGWLNSSTDFTFLNGKYYLWITNERAVDVTDLIKWPVLEANGEKLNFPRFFEDIPWPYVSIAWNWEEYVDWLGKQIPQGLKVVLNFSGGKDSIAAAKALIDAGADVLLLYSHVTFLEPERNIDFVERVSNKLGAKLEILAPEEEVMRHMLKQGMPFRGNRWCTTMKVRPIKKVLKEHKDWARADGERMTESLKRFKRLKGGKLFDGIRVRPIYALTLIDVVKAVRDANAVHPDYLMGLPRVACAFCPYRALHEFTEEDWKLVKDPGLIEEAMRASFKKHDYGITWEEFLEGHYWRFSPILGKKLYKMKKGLEGDELSSENVNRMYKSLWVEEIPVPKVMDPESGTRLLKSFMEKVYERASEGFAKARDLGVD
ncbi:hypothetical protein EYM_05135 [Ignicoccus islandicus DSM 13165]|uniref:Phosphoadenosine phosphosulphate reductase domain-containing protein n=1 Tax=Ignicoccus islandicus DSM 13165 TaxID=940295 RepID=A0A0U2MB45_9CREN|nr:phosphoadenosine phosphosulfate reductase family protein [Ignicoccus islandicus]ALU12557.1 hypothetical protein EYM_05135 [Ignicoccus islandicus DSM 13165]